MGFFSLFIPLIACARNLSCVLQLLCHIAILRHIRHFAKNCFYMFDHFVGLALKGLRCVWSYLLSYHWLWSCDRLRLYWKSS